MSVKTSQSGSRMLAVVEMIAARQPIGASALARLMDADKSAVQRSLATLAKAGWISATGDRPLRWELSARLFSLANLPHSSEELRRRAAPALADLRESTGETAFLAIPDLSRFVVVEVLESRRLLRTAPRVGEIIQPTGTATGRVMLAHMDAQRQAALLGRPPTEAEERAFAQCRECRYGVSIGEIVEGATNIAAPVLDGKGNPVAAIALSGPSDRLPDDRIAQLGRQLAVIAQGLLHASDDVQTD